MSPNANNGKRKCPKCGSIGRVYKTELVRDKRHPAFCAKVIDRIRYYRCDGCGATFSTIVNETLREEP